MLARKKRIQAGNQGSAARMMGRVDDLLTAETADPANRLQLAQLKLTLVEKRETLKQLDAEILEHLEDEIQRADDFKSNLYSARVKLDSVSSATSVPPTTIAPSTPVTPADRIKLPKLSIESIDGEVTKWIPLWDSYDSAIHKNSSLNDVDKFHYLRSLLKGVALEAVAGLMMTSANYREAISILRKRFRNKQQIISRHMEIHINVDLVSSNNNVKALRHLHDVVESNVRSLKALDISADSYGSLLSSVLMNKFLLSYG